MIPEHLAVVAHEDDDCILALSRIIQEIEQPAEFLIEEFDHGVVRRLDLLVLEFLGVARAILKVDIGLLPGAADVRRSPVFKAGARQGFRIVTPVIFIGRVEGRVRVEGVDAQQPGLIRLRDCAR